MVSLSVVILTLLILFAGIYFVYKMNKTAPMHSGHRQRRGGGNPQRKK